MKVGKSFGILLVLLMAVTTALAGCSGGNNKSEASHAPTNAATPDANAEEQPKEEEPLGFSFYVNYDWYAPKGLETDAKLLNNWLRDEKKVSIEEISSNGNAAQKLGTMIASDDLPDVMQIDRGADFDKLVEEGKLVAIDEYIDKYPNLKSVTTPEMLNLLRSKDGKLYGIPNWFGDPDGKKTTHTGWVVNKKIYTELGSPKLDTFDDLYAYLLQVKEKYPDVVPIDTANSDGGVVQVQNLIYAGMGASRPADFAKTDYLLAQGNFDTTTFESIFDDPAYLESYQYTSKLFREKLLTQDAFTQKREQFQEKLNNGKIAVAAVYDMAGAADQANQKLQASDPEAGYDYIPYIVKAGVNAEDISPMTSGTLGWNMNVITTSADNPERIFAFFDWLISAEGVSAAQYGPPGVYWEPDANGFPIFTEKYNSATKEQKDTDGIETFYFNLQGSPRWAEMDEAVLANMGKDKSWNMKANEFWGQSIRISSDQWMNVKNFAKGSEEDLANQQVKQVVEKAVAKMVFAKTDDEVKQVLEKAQKDANAAGYEKVLANMSKVWKENVEKMNQ